MVRGAYVLHGLMRDTDNQLARPDRVGSTDWPPWIMTLFMVILALVEVTGFWVLFIAAAMK